MKGVVLTAANAWGTKMTEETIDALLEKLDIVRNSLNREAYHNFCGEVAIAYPRLRDEIKDLRQQLAAEKQRARRMAKAVLQEHRDRCGSDDCRQPVEVKFAKAILAEDE